MGWTSCFYLLVKYCSDNWVITTRVHSVWVSRYLEVIKRHRARDAQISLAAHAHLRLGARASPTREVPRVAKQNY
jgi:hypothetical protein